MNPLVTILCLLYIVSPIDVLPDVIPVAGWIDDIGVIIYLLSQMGQKPQDSQKIDKS